PCSSVSPSWKPSPSSGSWSSSSPAPDQETSMTKLRLALVAAAVVLLGLLGFAGPASAEGDISHAAHLCIEQLEAGEDIDSCQKAPNPLLPETHEIIWGTFGFVVVLAGMWK